MKTFEFEQTYRKHHFVDDLWHENGAERTFNCPPISIYICKVGIDNDGNEWLCRCTFYPPKKKFMLEFDTNDYGENGGSSFFRESVIYADDYWNERMRYYKTKFCDYGEIPEKILTFARENGIEIED